MNDIEKLRQDIDKLYDTNDHAYLYSITANYDGYKLLRNEYNAVEFNSPPMPHSPETFRGVEVYRNNKQKELFKIGKIKWEELK